MSIVPTMARPHEPIGACDRGVKAFGIEPNSALLPAFRWGDRVPGDERRGGSRALVWVPERDVDALGGRVWGRRGRRCSPGRRWDKRP